MKERRVKKAALATASATTDNRSNSPQTHSNRKQASSQHHLLDDIVQQSAAKRKEQAGQGITTKNSKSTSQVQKHLQKKSIHQTFSGNPRNTTEHSPKKPRSMSSIGNLLFLGLPDRY